MLRKKFKIRQFLKAQANDLETIVAMMSVCVFDDDTLLTPEAARDVVLDMTPEDLDVAMRGMLGAMAEAAVPPKSAAT